MDLNKQELEEQISRLSSKIEGDKANIELLFSRAILYNKLGDKTLAYNDFASVLKIDPNHEEAKTHMQMLLNIFNFGNREVINV